MDTVWKMSMDKALTAMFRCVSQSKP